MKAAVLFSGGKDSTYVAYLAKERDEVRCLVAITPLSQDSYMFHYPNIRWTELQSQAMSLPRLNFETVGVKEEELRDLRSAIRFAKERFSIEALYTGAIASVYQKSRVEQICAEVGIDCISPLWGIEPEVHLRTLLKAGFSVVFTGVAALGLDERWLGRTLDSKAIAELLELQRRYGINPTLEGGEGETFVVDCPAFSRRIEIISSRRHWSGDSGYLEILEAELVPK